MPDKKPPRLPGAAVLSVPDCRPQGGAQQRPGRGVDHRERGDDTAVPAELTGVGGDSGKGDPVADRPMVLCCDNAGDCADSHAFVHGDQPPFILGGGAAPRCCRGAFVLGSEADTAGSTEQRRRRKMAKAISSAYIEPACLEEAAHPPRRVYWRPTRATREPIGEGRLVGGRANVRQPIRWRITIIPDRLNV
jgi:hypothetical protein